MGGDTQVYNAKNPRTYLLNSNYEKRAKYNPTFRQDNFFSPSSNSDSPVSTQRVFPQKEKNKSKFLIVNLCNDGTKDLSLSLSFLQKSLLNH